MEYIWLFWESSGILHPYTHMHILPHTEMLPLSVGLYREVWSTSFFLIQGSAARKKSLARNKPAYGGFSKYQSSGFNEVNKSEARFLFDPPLFGNLIKKKQESHCAVISPFSPRI